MGTRRKGYDRLQTEWTKPIDEAGYCLNPWLTHQFLKYGTNYGDM